MEKKIRHLEKNLIIAMIESTDENEKSRTEWSKTHSGKQSFVFFGFVSFKITANISILKNCIVSILFGEFEIQFNFQRLTQYIFITCFRHEDPTIAEAQCFPLYLFKFQILSILQIPTKHQSWATTISFLLFYFYSIYFTPIAIVFISHQSTPISLRMIPFTHRL